ncbi:helix-turn-helix domain-containing protein [Crossiella cryophila]|uniref:Transcriptional regulator with XRE-family HTH domain n=1 Tax=Crossiella cryophila TaxID=43355 RepID=A0A7W7CE58_9PSEU|nr:helix-turn-helix transcriptional regulator [Crossiella cryophila]MBB4679525.1 transcriptional regulator with XRE-family HTH domain [Crossiella cryophila]
MLREMREAKRLTLAAVAKATGCSVTKIQRMETGERGMDPSDVSALLNLYKAPAELRDNLVDLLSTPADRDWWYGIGTWLPLTWRREIPLEDEATVLRAYTLGSIPLLLQTAAYSQAFLSCLYPHLSYRDVRRLVGILAARQLILDRDPMPRLHFLIDEAALRRPIGGPGVHAQQLQAVAAAAARPNLTVQVVPLSAGAHPGVAGSMTLLEFAELPAMAATAESAGFEGSKPFVEDNFDLWDAIEKQASSEEATTQMLRSRAGLLLNARTPTRAGNRTVAEEIAFPSQTRRSDASPGKPCEVTISLREPLGAQGEPVLAHPEGEQD